MATKLANPAAGAGSCAIRYLGRCTGSRLRSLWLVVATAKLALRVPATATGIHTAIPRDTVGL